MILYRYLTGKILAFFTGFELFSSPVIGIAAVGILILLVWFIIYVIQCMNASEYDFACPGCSKRFYVKWYKLYGPYHGAYGLYAHTAVLKCPACEKKGICYMPDFYPADFKPPSNWRGK